MIDDFDRAILRIVQMDNQLTHAKIGEQVGLSNSAVRRRLKILRESGVIDRDVAILSGDASGITAIVNVAFAVDTPEAYSEFDRVVRANNYVKQAYHVSGTTDYVLVVQGESLGWYEAWAKEVLMSSPHIKRHDTKIVYSCKKFETAREI